MSAKVVVTNLEKRYGPVLAARGVSFEIRDGETFGLIGPNGAGKTTTVECVIGLREPDAGAIEVCGIDARRRPRDVKQKIGAALQTTVAAGQDHAARGARCCSRRSTTATRRPRRCSSGFTSRRKGRCGLRHALGRSAAAARAGPRVRQQSGARVPRRADGRARPAIAPRAARRNRGDEARRPHRAAHDAQSRRKPRRCAIASRSSIAGGSSRPGRRPNWRRSSASASVVSLRAARPIERRAGSTASPERRIS